MISKVEKGRINKQNYEAYVKTLRETGAKFPLNNFGDVNLTEIGRQCGFNRQVFSTNKKMAERLEQDIKAIGTELSKPKNSDEFLSKKVSDHEKLIGQLRKENALLKERIDVMKSQIMESESTITRLKNQGDEDKESYDHMLLTGRRFFL